MKMTKQWTATLKDGRTVTISYMGRKEKDTVVELYKEMVVEVWSVTPEIDVAEFLDRQKRKWNKTLVAVTGGRIVSFMEMLREAGEQELASSYTIKGIRSKGINECLRWITILEFDGDKIIKGIFTDKSKGILLPKYEALMEKAKMVEKERRDNAIYFEKTAESDGLIEGLLEERFGVDY